MSGGLIWIIQSGKIQNSPIPNLKYKLLRNSPLPPRGLIWSSSGIKGLFRNRLGVTLVRGYFGSLFIEIPAHSLYTNQFKENVSESESDIRQQQYKK